MGGDGARPLVGEWVFLLPHVLPSLPDRVGWVSGYCDWSDAVSLVRVGGIDYFLWPDELAPAPGPA
ncbi:MAG: hypothetical protein M3Q10_09285 [Chloroflexota bacterium]|nr:hypothetical protein [Chloroflexota bacterium]